MHDCARGCGRRPAVQIRSAFTEELTQDLTRIIRLLKEYGLNMEYVSPNYGKTALEQYKEEPVCSILSSD